MKILNRNNSKILYEILKAWITHLDTIQLHFQEKKIQAHFQYVLGRLATGNVIQNQRSEVSAPDYIIDSPTEGKTEREIWTVSPLLVEKLQL